jgi:hypothetical protein
MKIEMSICRSNKLLEALINGGRETTELEPQFWLGYLNLQEQLNLICKA